MPQFVLLRHECPAGVPRATHWDLMLQIGSTLRTWVLSELPAAWRTSLGSVQKQDPVRDGVREVRLTAEEIQPHRIEYLTLEGPLSGGRGTVTRSDRGTYETLEVSDRRVRVRLSGERLSGMLELARPDAQTPQWQLRFSAETPP